MNGTALLRADLQYHSPRERQTEMTRMNKAHHHKATNMLTERVFQLSRRTSERCLSPAPLRCAIAGVVSKRGQYVLRSTAPSFRANPLGNLLKRSLDWHSSGGHLGALFSTRADVGLLAHAGKLESRAEFERHFGAYWSDHKSQLWEHSRLIRGMSSDTIWDCVQTVAVLMRGGHSAACDAWKRALHGV